MVDKNTLSGYNGFMPIDKVTQYHNKIEPFVPTGVSGPAKQVREAVDKERKRILGSIRAGDYRAGPPRVFYIGADSATGHSISAVTLGYREGFWPARCESEENKMTNSLYEVFIIDLGEMNLLWNGYEIASSREIAIIKGIKEAERVLISNITECLDGVYCYRARKISDLPCDSSE